MLHTSVKEKLERIETGQYPKYTHPDYLNVFRHECIAVPCICCKTTKEELEKLQNTRLVALENFAQQLLNDQYKFQLAEQLRVLTETIRKVKMFIPAPNIKFEFVKRITTKSLSIFYSAIHYKDEILGFARNHYGAERKILPVKFNRDFDIIEEQECFRGEDPRCFIHNDNLYVQDNYFNNMFLYDYERKIYTNIAIDGKNLSYVSHNGKLYFIHYMKPFVLYEHNLDTNSITHIETVGGETNYEYRGGTPGYKIGNTDRYFGFGHRTYWKNGLFLHDPFLWIISFEKEIPQLVIHDLEKPANAQSIMDPTSVIMVDNKYYMLTAETVLPWFSDQDYITNLYEIKNLDKILH